ncbi:TIGR02444 family protein [Asticcacaulis sp. BYS171W]|uniref:TIGR02444 family protein n=1 Tax=Asticcacaulis aquaticus TaxID=2984212 RepID=A0ABT5HQV9_9CAUL|nr:TIGR02444 family protein [Asticcacaulis aquaticus]
MSNFWNWAVKAYAAESVAGLCLDLQDMHGQNVPLLLFSQWAASVGVALDEETAEAAADISRAWAHHVVGPLRAIRRQIKGPIGDIEPDAKHRVREQVKSAELLGEREQMAALSALISPTGQALAFQQAKDNLVRVARAWAPVVPRNPLHALSDALSERGFLSYTPE